MTATVHPDTTGSDDPISSVVARLHAVLDAAAEVDASCLDAVGCREALVGLTRAVDRVVELRARVLVQADEVDAFPGVSTANGFAVAAGVTRHEAHRHARLARLLHRHARLREAFAAGRLHADQARVIAEAVDALPAEVSDAVREEALLHLVAEAKHFDAHDLARLGRRVLEVVDPAAGEAHAARQLADEERAAAEKTMLAMSDDGHGLTHGRFRIPTAQGQMLRKALMALAAPKHQRSVDGTGASTHDKPTAKRLGEAFCEYVETYPADHLPQTGGVNATVVVTTSLDTLQAGLGAASLDTGAEVSPGQVRRWACDAALIPAVLGGTSVVLDLGRTRRLFTRLQRIALGLRQRHCQHPGCDVPAAFCHAHHDEPWSKGGRTDLKNGRLLCPRHHHLVHDEAQAADLAHINPIQRT